MTSSQQTTWHLLSFWILQNFAVIFYSFQPTYSTEISCRTKTSIEQWLSIVGSCQSVYGTNISKESYCSSEKQNDLKSLFEDWHFDPVQLLASTFPIDTQHKNSVKRSIPHVIFSLTDPTPLKSRPRLAAYSSSALELLDMQPGITEDEDFVDFVSGNLVRSGDPAVMAHRYGGHQFGYWSGQLGDGRAHFLGEYVSVEGIRWELQLKGSGKTAYSRDGDGRAVIRSSVREFLCSEAMYHLGIPSSRAVTLVVSDDPVWRDQFYNGNPRQESAAVVLRLTKSWFRFGSLEILLKNKETDLLRKLVDFIIKEYFTEIDHHNPDKYLEFFSEVVRATAELIAQWQSVGFAHGVMNTDNFSILSITIDYGPFGFLDDFDPEFVPNTSDDEGMYRFKKQPEVGIFNLEKLRLALMPLLSKDQKKQTVFILNGYNDIYKLKFMELFRKKLGLLLPHENDKALIALWLKILQETRGDFTMSFRQLGDWPITEMEAQISCSKQWALLELSKHKLFHRWVEMYRSRFENEDITESHRRQLMHSVNPRYVLRNWIAQKAIDATEEGDFSYIDRVHRVLQNPFVTQLEGEDEGFAKKPPTWSKSLKVSCSS